jgi:hypothetical protein
MELDLATPSARGKALFEGMRPEIALERVSERVSGEGVWRGCQRTRVRQAKPG